MTYENNISLLLLEYIKSSYNGDIKKLLSIKDNIHYTIKRKKGLNPNFTELECSSKGDKRFSALYCKVSVNGKIDTIENHYQLNKVFIDLETKNPVRFNNFKEVKHAQYLKDKYDCIGFNIGHVFLDSKYMTA